MKRDELAGYLRSEKERWSRLSYEALVLELAEEQHYEVGGVNGGCQVEVTLLEHVPEYVHVMVSVDDGGWRAFAPLSESFVVRRDVA